ncbi:MAG: D-aminoacylase [Acidobacteria bacterium]|nr:D-aminoacylase [Acidobacteriota bacterium]
MRFAILAAVASLAPAQQFDLLITNARVVDGMGNPWFNADIGIRGDRIAEIGSLRGRPAARTLDAGGQVASPGFVDMMGGASSPMLLDPTSAVSKLTQGITTIFAGEGGSDAPQTPQTLSADFLKAGYRWSAFAGYFALLEKRGMGVNAIHNVGAAQLRRVVIGMEDREPTAAELDRMRSLADAAMRDGAVGFSTALIYPPGTYAKRAELVEIGKVVARHGGIYSTHMRNESSQLLEAIEEAIDIGKQSGVPVHIYHLKAAGQENWPLMQKAVDRIAAARAAGQDVTADVYPYIRNGLGLSALIHPRHFAKGRAPFAQALPSPEFRAGLRREIEETSNWENWYRHAGSNWDNILIATVSRGGDKRLEGRSLAEAAKILGKDEWTTFFDLLAGPDPSVNPRSMNEEQKHLAMRTPFVSFDTDASPTNPATATGAHPRAFGSFPRILAKYVREDRVIPLEEAIRKMTSLAANRLKLYDRGRIAPGMAADLVVFDPDRIQDHASFTQPLAMSAGIRWVVVNGKVALEDGKMTGVMAGRVLRPNAKMK